MKDFGEFSEKEGRHVLIALVQKVSRDIASF